MALEQVGRQGLVLLGCGKMGGALLAGWLEAGLPARSVHVIEPHPSDWLRGTGVNLGGTLPDAPAVAVIAVKPQSMGESLPALNRFGNGGTLVLSIAAGTTIATIESALGRQTPVVRAMPNTPAMVGRGISALCANAHVGVGQHRLARELMSAVGEVVDLEGEHQMDAVTALSGSGPAYVFHLVEAMAAAGAAEGLPEALAMQLARATVSGAGELVRRSDEAVAQLRANVTSPGGTTAAGLAVLMDEATGFPPLLRRAIHAAAERGRELGR